MLRSPALASARMIQLRQCQAHHKCLLSRVTISLAWLKRLSSRALQIVTSLFQARWCWILTVRLMSANSSSEINYRSIVLLEIWEIVQLTYLWPTLNSKQSRRPADQTYLKTRWLGDQDKRRGQCHRCPINRCSRLLIRSARNPHFMWSNLRRFWQI